MFDRLAQNLETADLEVSFFGVPRSKKNSRRWDPHTGRNFPSAAFADYARKNAGPLALQAPQRPITRAALIVIVHTIPPKSTNADGDNLDTAVLDLLVDAEILASDNLKTFQTRLSHAEICESGPWGTRVRFYGVSYDAAPKTKKTAKPRPESKKPAPQPQKQTARLDLGQTKPPSGRVERIFSKKIKKLFLTRNN